MKYYITRKKSLYLVNLQQKKKRNANPEVTYARNQSDKMAYIAIKPKACENIKCYQ